MKKLNIWESLNNKNTQIVSQTIYNHSSSYIYRIYPRIVARA